MAALDPHAYSSRVHLSSGATLYTKVPPEEWATLFARAASTKHESDTHWIALHDGRSVLVQLRHVAFVEPSPDWKPKREPGMTRQSRKTEQTFGPDYSPE
jgi:hypothetical protein